jgi:hypothetical protein
MSPQAIILSFLLAATASAAPFSFDGGFGETELRAVFIKGAQDVQALLKAENDLLQARYPGSIKKERYLTEARGWYYNVVKFRTRDNSAETLFFDVTDFIKSTKGDVDKADLNVKISVSEAVLDRTGDPAELYSKGEDAVTLPLGVIGVIRPETKKGKEAVAAVSLVFANTEVKSRVDQEEMIVKLREAASAALSTRSIRQLEGASTDAIVKKLLILSLRLQLAEAGISEGLAGVDVNLRLIGKS